MGTGIGQAPLIIECFFPLFAGLSALTGFLKWIWFRFLIPGSRFLYFGYPG